MSNSYFWILQKTSKNGCQGLKGVYFPTPSQQPKPIEHSGATSTATPMGKAGQNLGHLGHDFTPLEPENDDGMVSKIGISFCRGDFFLTCEPWKNSREGVKKIASFFGQSPIQLFGKPEVLHRLN